jgi:hypothetical protein
MMKKSPMIVAVFSWFAVFLMAVLAVPPAHPSSHEFEILTLSTRPEMVSGGDALVGGSLRILVFQKIPLKRKV